jgi:hypothetical protein
VSCFVVLYYIGPQVLGQSNWRTRILRANHTAQLLLVRRRLRDNPAPAVLAAALPRARRAAAGLGPHAAEARWTAPRASAHIREPVRRSASVAVQVSVVACLRSVSGAFSTDLHRFEAVVYLNSCMFPSGRPLSAVNEDYELSVRMLPPSLVCCASEQGT